MTALNTSFLTSPAAAASREFKKGVTAPSKSNTYSVEVVDLEGDSNEFEIFALSENSASEQAYEIAWQSGIAISYLNIYRQY